MYSMQKGLTPDNPELIARWSQEQKDGVNSLTTRQRRFIIIIIIIIITQSDLLRNFITRRSTSI
jgi:hypothetical protein